MWRIVSAHKAQRCSTPRVTNPSHSLAREKSPCLRLRKSNAGAPNAPTVAACVTSPTRVASHPLPCIAHSPFHPHPSNALALWSTSHCSPAFAASLPTSNQSMRLVLQACAISIATCSRPTPRASSRKRSVMYSKPLGIECKNKIKCTGRGVELCHSRHLLE